MNREEIEKEFDERFHLVSDAPDFSANDIKPEVKSFFFDTILPDVLINVLPYNWDKQWDEYDSNTITEEIRKIAKTQYNINL